MNLKNLTKQPPKAVATTLLVSTLLATTDTQANLVTADYQWQGPAGYRVAGTVTFDDAEPVIDLLSANAAGGEVRNIGIDYFDLHAWDPTGTQIIDILYVLDETVITSMTSFSFALNTETFTLAHYTSLGEWRPYNPSIQSFEADPGDQLAGIYDSRQSAIRGGIVDVGPLSELTWAVRGDEDDEGTIGSPTPWSLLVVGGMLLVHRHRLRLRRA